MITDLKKIIDGVSKDILNKKLFLDSTVACGENLKNLILYPQKKMEVKLFPHTPRSIFLMYVKDMLNKIIKKR